MEEKKVILQDLLLRHPADIAEVFPHLSEKQAIELAHCLYLHKGAAEPLGEMETDESAAFLSDLDRVILVNEPQKR